MQPLLAAQMTASDGGKNTKADYPTEIGEEVTVLGVEVKSLRSPYLAASEVSAWRCTLAVSLP